MNAIQIRLNIILRISHNVQNHFVNKRQNEIERYIYCNIEKLSKISKALVQLYPHIEVNNELEFSLGLLARSILMDIIVFMPARRICSKSVLENSETIQEELTLYCYKVINDGTKHLLNEIHLNENISEEEKNELYSKFSNLFPGTIDESKVKPTLKKEFKLDTLANIYKDNKQDSSFEDVAAYNLYNYYSKYEHLSHYTSLSSHFPFHEKKEKLEASIILMMRHLRDLLCIAHDFCNGYQILLPLIREIDEQLSVI